MMREKAWFFAMVFSYPVLTMRLDSSTRREIRESARRFFGADVYLFGSRTDDAKRGGDIDLYIEAPMSAAEAVRSRIAMLGHLYSRIGERKIDLVVNSGGGERPIFREARQHGEKL